MRWRYEPQKGALHSALCLAPQSLEMFQRYTEMMRGLEKALTARTCAPNTAAEHSEASLGCHADRVRTCVYADSEDAPAFILRDSLSDWRGKILQDILGAVMAAQGQARHQNVQPTPPPKHL